MWLVSKVAVHIALLLASGNENCLDIGGRLNILTTDSSNKEAIYGE